MTVWTLLIASLCGNVPLSSQAGIGVWVIDPLEEASRGSPYPEGRHFFHFAVVIAGIATMAAGIESGNTWLSLGGVAVIALDETSETTGKEMQSYFETRYPELDSVSTDRLASLTAGKIKQLPADGKTYAYVTFSEEEVSWATETSGLLESSPESYSRILNELN